MVAKNTMKADECIFFQLAKVSQLGGKLWGQKVSDLNITATQAMVLRFLHDEDGVTSVNLGKKTDLDSATITGVLDRLENADLIKRKDNPNDGRSIHIFLTGKGNLICVELAKRVEVANAEFLKNMNQAEKKELRRLITKIRIQSIA